LEYDGYCAIISGTRIRIFNITVFDNTRFERLGGISGQEKVEILPEHLYGRWAQWYGALIDGYFEMFESGGGIIYFSPDDTGTYAGMWDDAVIYFAWQISDNEITMIDDMQEKVGTISWGTDSLEELNRDEFVISWFDTGIPDWGLFRR